jgi:hypothetical protein
LSEHERALRIKSNEQVVQEVQDAFDGDYRSFATKVVHGLSRLRFDTASNLRFDKPRTSSSTVTDLLRTVRIALIRRARLHKSV